MWIPAYAVMTKQIMDEQNLNVKIIPPKEYIPHILVGVGIILIIFLAVLSVNGIREGRYIGRTEANTVTISGQGKVLAKSDIGQIDLSVVTQAASVSAAVTENNDKMNKITKALKDLGIAEDDLKTASYNVNPSYQYTAGKSTIIGYEVNQTLQVKIRDLNKASQVLEKAASSGANQVGSLSFTIDDTEKLKEEARKQAIEKAKKKAEEMEKALGIRLGKIIGFNEYEASSMSAYDGFGGIGGGGMEKAIPTPQIQPGQNEIIVNVDLAFEVK